MAEEVLQTLLDEPDISVLLQDLPPSVQSDVCGKLAELGICQASDMKYLNPEKDLDSVLRPIQARKLAAAISDMFAVKEPTEVEDYSRTLMSRSPSISSTASSDSLTSPSVSPSQNWMASFKIPFDKFPAELIEACEKGEIPKTSLRLEMVRILCSEIARYTRLPGRRNVEIISGRINARYPKSFMDKIGSEVLGTGYSGLVSQIMVRMVNTYGRGLRSKRSSTESESSLDITVKRKTSTPDCYGCVNFSPSNLPEDETEESLLVMKQVMTQEVQKPKPQRDEIKVKLYMSKTYVLQRRSINQDPPLSIRHIKDEWPFLFQCDFMVDHFEELTGIDVKRKLHMSLADKAKSLLNFVTTKRNKSRGVKEWIDKILMSGGLTEENFCLIIPVLSACFGEDPSLLIKIYEDTMNSSDVGRVTKEVTPHVAVIGELCRDSTKYFLVVEKSVVTEDITSLEHALAMTFASFYVFNLQYHSGLPATLEFIQRCFIDLNPSRGSKSRAKKSGVANSKVVGFLRSYEEFHWNIGD